MKRLRVTEKQIIGILREQQAAVKTADLCRKHGISSATFFKWKSKFGGMGCVGHPRAEEAAGRATEVSGRASFEMPSPDGVRLFRLTPIVISVLDYSKGFGHTDLVAT